MQQTALCTRNAQSLVKYVTKLSVVLYNVCGFCIIHFCVFKKSSALNFAFDFRFLNQLGTSLKN